MWLELQLKIQAKGLANANTSDQNQAGNVQGRILGSAGKNQSVKQVYKAEIKPTRRTQLGAKVKFNSV